MPQTSHTFSATIWLYPGETASWHFLTLPKALGATIKETYGTSRRGFGSLPVTVTIGETTFATSLFPDRVSGSYFLPLKAAVRKKEDLFVGDTVAVSFTIRKNN